MNNETLIEIKCDGCMEAGHSQTMVRKSWTYHDPYDKYGWALEEGEQETGTYCDDCVTDINAINADYYLWLNSNTELTLEEWQDLALTLALGYKNSVTNWKDGLSTREKYALRQLVVG
jgi:hypothetical protein